MPASEPPAPEDVSGAADDAGDMPAFCEATDGDHGCALQPGHAGPHMTLGGYRFT